MRCRLIAGSVALALSLTPVMASAQLREGTFRVEGTNPNGSRYTGTFLLQGSPGAGWTATWVMDGARLTGPAVIEGGILAAAYVLGGRTGVAAYVPQDNGSLRGTWTTGSGVGTEMLIPGR